MHRAWVCVDEQGGVGFAWRGRQNPGGLAYLCTPARRPCPFDPAPQHPAPHRAFPTACPLPAVRTMRRVRVHAPLLPTWSADKPASRSAE
jgi:hypothetical protein